MTKREFILPMAAPQGGAKGSFRSFAAIAFGTAVIG
jgi:hypothetical protein